MIDEQIIRGLKKLVRKQKAEIERLKQKDNRWALSYVNAIARGITARENAIKEFAERLKAGEVYIRCEFPCTKCGTDNHVVLPADIDDLVDDLVREMLYETDKQTHPTEKGGESDA